MRCTGTETRLIVTCCHQFVVAFVVIDPVILVKFTFHFLSVVLSAQLNLETGMSFSSIWLNTFVKFSRMDLETPAWNKRKSEVVASQGQGRRAARQGGGRGRQRSRCSLATGPGAGHSVVSQRGRAEGIDRHRLQNLSCPLRGARGRGNGRGRSVLSRSSGRHEGQTRGRTRRGSRAAPSTPGARVGGVP